MPAAKVMGYVREVKAQTGDAVKAGQLLILLDDRDLASGYRQALEEAKLDQDTWEDEKEAANRLADRQRYHLRPDTGLLDPERRDIDTDRNFRLHRPVNNSS